jgi:hypothetical protein
MLRSTMERAQSTVNVILFVTLLLAAIIIAVWYISTVRPTKEIIGRLSDDIGAVRRHLLNACESQLYTGRYPFKSTGLLDVTSDGFCIDAGGFRKCSDAPCGLEPVNITLNGTIVNITRSGDDPIQFMII